MVVYNGHHSQMFFLALGMPSSLGFCKISTAWLVAATFCYWLYTIAADLMEFDSMFLDVVDSLFVYVMFFFFFWAVFLGLFGLFLPTSDAYFTK